GQDHPTMADSFTLTADGFASDEAIPVRFTCDGENRSPALSWSGAPSDADSLALIVEDPDAPRGTFTHWIVFDIPTDFNDRTLSEAVKFEGANGPREGTNDFGRIGYGGPCPPPGSPHRYVFRLYAVNTRLGLRTGVTKDQVTAALSGHVLAETSLV